MRSRIGLLCVVAILSSAPLDACASITAFWQPVTITPAAISNDPALANMQCWDLMVTTTGNWASAATRADLPGGQLFYKHTLGGFTRPHPTQVASTPALAFSTYVAAPSDDGVNNSTIVVGGHPQITPSLGDLNGIFSMFWSDFVTDLPGTFAIARLTFPQQVLPQVLHGGDPSRTSQVNPDGLALIPDIPEPTALTLAIAVGMSQIIMARFRRLSPTTWRTHRKDEVHEELAKGDTQGPNRVS
jgi:hypothetical protein